MRSRFADLHSFSVYQKLGVMARTTTPPPHDTLVLNDMTGWTEAEPFPRGHTKHSFISGRKDSLAIRVRYFEKKAENRFAARAWFGPESEGPPGHAHGGSQASLLDEGMGAAAWISGHPVLAVKLEINFRASLPLHTLVTMRSEITKVDGRKVFVKAELAGDDGAVFSESTGIFLEIDTKELIEKVRKAAGQS